MAAISVTRIGMTAGGAPKMCPACGMALGERGAAAGQREGGQGHAHERRTERGLIFHILTVSLTIATDLATAALLIVDCNKDQGGAE